MIDFCATEPHFFDHLAPVWIALQTRAERGQFYVTSELVDRARAQGIQVEELPAGLELPPSQNPTVVVAYGDMKRARNVGRPVILGEHGAGQGYMDDETGLPLRSGSYIGARDREGVIGVLVPGRHALLRHQSAHPDTPAIAVGCPKFDRWLRLPRPALDPPVIGISFHWDSRAVAETRAAWRYYVPALKTLAQTYPGLLGHAHPRLGGVMTEVYRSLGIEVVADFDTIVARASLYAVDNSSTLFEFAALNRPVVVINAPFYRREVHHGLRFWEFADVGVQVGDWTGLVEGVVTALLDDDARSRRRREVTQAIYGDVDGHASDRAAAAVLALSGKGGG